MPRLLTLLAPALVLSAMSALGQTPASELRAAVADLERLPPEVRPGVRYLSLYAVAPERRDETSRVAGYLLNALSRTRAITRPDAVSPTLLRFSISSYIATGDEFQAWSAAWEKLVDREPYWHLRTEVATPRVPESPRPRVAQQDAETRGHGDAGNTTQAVTIDGGWLSLPDAATLRTLTLSNGALLRADDFIARASASPVYYDFAGVPATEDEFLKSLGVDPATIERLRANAGANLIISGVTQKPRRIVWVQGPLGGVYQTLDVATVDAVRDPLRRPISADGTQLTFDAGEWFAAAPNGLWRVALYDAQGKLQQTVPDKIAKDTSDPAADGIVTPLVSCIRCHVESGLRPFRDDQTRLLAGHVDLRSSDPNIVQRAAEFYDEPRLKRQMDFDRATYDQAVARATGGLKAEELAAALARSVREFAYRPLGREQAARELGLWGIDLHDVLAASHDPIILALLEGRPVLRGQWESSFAEAATLAEAWRTRQ